MQTTSSRKPGNRRSENKPEGGAAPAKNDSVAETTPMFSAPKISNQPFHHPGQVLLGELPSIKKVVSPAPAQPAVVENQPANSAPVAQNPATAEEVRPAEVPAPVEPTAPPVQTEPEETLENCWQEIVTALFSKNDLLFFSLSRQLPKYENGVMTIEVRSQIQQEELDKRRRPFLEFWRSHYKINLDDFEIVLNEEKIKSSIMGPDEQFAAMNEQNPQLLEFLNILNCRMKD